MGLDLVERPTTGATERLLVLLPGYGDEPRTFTSRLDRIDPDGRWHVAVARPRLATAHGPAWFTVGDDGPDADQLTGSVGALAETLAELLDRLGLTSEAMVLGGFSQGGALALATLLDPGVATPPAAVAVLAGYLPHRETDQDQSLAADRPVLLAHGADDDMVDTIRGRSAAKALHRAGAAVTWTEVAGGHTLGAPLLDPLRDWLAAVAAGARPARPPI